MAVAAFSDVLGAIGFVLFGAVGATLLGALFAIRLDRDAAEREWLRESLSAFYAPVSAKLEAARLWNRAIIVDERERRLRTEETLRQRTEMDPPDPPEAVEARRVSDSEYETKIRRQMLLSNVETRRAVSRLIESNLHYADEPQLRQEGLEYLKTARMEDWQHAALDLEGTIDKTIVVLSKEEDEHVEEFRRRVLAEFERRGERFRQLSRGRGLWERLRARVPSVSRTARNSEEPSAS